MCKASVMADKWEDSTDGQKLKIGVSDHGLGAFHKPGTPVAKCVVCVKNGMTLTLSNISATLRKKYGIGETEVIRFIDTGDNRHDLLAFANGKRAPLVDFANMGVEVTVGEVKATTDMAIQPKKTPFWRRTFAAADGDRVAA
jgi:hypothetical protein